MVETSLKTMLSGHPALHICTLEETDSKISFEAIVCRPVCFVIDGSQVDELGRIRKVRKKVSAFTLEEWKSTLANSIERFSRRNLMSVPT
jgi:hypothetical protein